MNPKILSPSELLESKAASAIGLIQQGWHLLRMIWDAKVLGNGLGYPNLDISFLFLQKPRYLSET